MITDTPPFIKGIIGGRTVVQEYDEAFSDITVIERSSMATVATMRIAERYMTDQGDQMWITKEVGYNILGEAIYIRKLPHGNTPPDFALTLTGIVDS